MSGSQQKVLQGKQRNREIWLIHRKWRIWQETISEEANMLRLLIKDVKSTILNMLNWAKYNNGKWAKGNQENNA